MGASKPSYGHLGKPQLLDATGTSQTVKLENFIVKEMVEEPDVMKGRIHL